MEEKLKSYRLRKRRVEKIESLKERFFNMISINIPVSDKKSPDVADVLNTEVSRNLWE